MKNKKKAKKLTKKDEAYRVKADREVLDRFFKRFFKN